MTLRRLNLEHIFFLLALLLAVCLRLYRLGATPLSDAEARWALQALEVAGSSSTNGPNASINLGPQPGYVLITGFLFSMFQSSNFLARLLPALAGILLIIIPYLLRHQIGRAAALVMAFGLAFDPGLVTVSRQAGSPMVALAFALLAFGFWYWRKAVLTGIFAALALLSGPSLIAGLIPLGIAWLVTRLALGKSSAEQRGDDPEDSATWEKGEHPSLEKEQHLDHPSRMDTRAALIAAGITFILVGTLLFRFPQGLSAWLEMIPAYLQGWTTPSGIPSLRLPAALIFYQPLALLFALIGVLFGLTQRNLRTVLFFTVWLIVSLGLSMLYPARQVADLVWGLVPLWGLAALEIKRYLPERNLHPVSGVLALLIFILMALFWFSLASLTRAPAETSGPNARLLVLLGIFALILLSTALVALGWSWHAGRTGLVWGVSIGLTFYLVSVMWGAAQLRFNQPQELWGLPPATGQADLLKATLNDLSDWSVGFPDSIDVLSTVDLPSMRWFLRNVPDVQYISEVPLGEQPSILITPESSEDPSLAAAYRGQDFVWSVYPGWSGALPPNLLSWFTFRQAPLQLESVIFWARNDLFPGVTPAVEPTGGEAP